MSTPYDMARKKKLMQTGSVLGSAVVNALAMACLLCRVFGAKRVFLSVFRRARAAGFFRIGHLTIVVPCQMPLVVSASVMAGYARSGLWWAIMSAYRTSWIEKEHG